jgi:hypothetical protein
MRLRSFLSSAYCSLMAVLMISVAGQVRAQSIPNYPTFTGGGETTMQTNGSPALGGSPSSTNHLLYIAYPDSTNSGNLTIGYSTDGINFTLTQTSIQMQSDAGVTTSQYGDTFYIAFTYGDVIAVYSYTVSGGVTLYATLTPNTTFYSYQPALAIYHNDLYIAWVGTGYDPSTGGVDGPWINVAYADMTSSSPSFVQDNFGYGEFPQVVSNTSNAGTGPALAVWNNTLYLSYLDANTGAAGVFSNYSIYSSTPATALTFSSATSSGDAGGIYKGTPALVSFDGSLFDMFRSYYSENNLWAVGSNGPPSWGNEYMYGQSLTNSPTLAVVNMGAGSSTTLFQGGRTNYPGGGPYIWIYNSTYNGINPNPAQSGGGGGDDGGGDCGDQNCVN